MRYASRFLVLSIWILVSCEKVEQPKQVNESPEIRNLVQLRNDGNLGKPTVVNIDQDSLDVRKASGRKITMKPTTIKPNLLSRTEVLRPKRISIDLSQTVTGNRTAQQFSKPRLIDIPKTGFVVIENDTIYAPTTNIAAQPEPKIAQPMRFRDAALHDIQFLDVEQGLPSSYIDAIYEDSDGNLWFGTYGGGVCRYNGTTLTTYTIDEGIANNVVVEIIEDRNGNLWFGTDNGVTRYDGQTFTNYSTEQGLSGQFVEAIVEDLNGHLWIATSRGLTKFENGDAESFTNYYTENGLPSNVIYAVEVDQNGTLWIGTRNGLSRFDGTSFTNFDTDNGLPHDILRSVFEDSKGNLWIGSEGGVTIYDGQSFEIYTKEQGLLNHRIWDVKEDKDQNIWLGTDGGGVYKMELETGDNDQQKTYLTLYEERDGLSYNFIRSMYADRLGNMWLGIDGAGISKFKTNSFSSFSSDKNLSTNSVWSIYEDSAGNLWFGSDLWGIYKYRNGNFHIYMDTEDLLEYSVMDMVEDHNQDMWFASYGNGIFKYDGKSFMAFGDQEGLSNPDIYTIIQDQKKQFWLGTLGGGIIRFDGSKFTTFTSKDGLPNDHVWHLMEDAKGNIWIATYGGGLCKYDGTSFTTYTMKQGLLDNGINSILEDHEGNLWLGTDNGLNKIVFANESGQQDQIYSLSTEDGLTNQITLSLIEDNDHNIWIGTEGGITRLKPVEDQADHIFELSTFVQQDGLKGLDVVINSVTLDSENRIWWGTGKGLTKLELDKFELNNELPKIQLNGVSIGPDYVDYRRLADSEYRTSVDEGTDLYGSFDSLVPFQNYPENLALPNNLDHLTFHFSAIDWLGLHKVNYQYMLEGLDDNWSTPGKRNSAEYRNLDYGEYTFKVRAISGTNQVTETVSYSFVIIRPWWHTWGARILYLVILILSVYSFDRWRTFRILKKQKEVQRDVEERNMELERLVAERTAEIKRQQQITEEANQDLERKVKERTQELVEKNTKLAEYAFVNAHNLRVPVANIKGIIQLVEMVKSDEEKLELIELLKGQSNKLDEVLFEIKEMLERDNSQ